MSKKIRIRIFEILEPASENDSASKAFDIFIVVLISLNIIAVIFETVRSLSINYLFYFRIFEVISEIIFTSKFRSPSYG